MANTKIKFKQSSVANNQPSAEQLDQGELAINTADQLLFSKDSSDNIFEIGQDRLPKAGGTITGNLTVDGVTYGIYHGVKDNQYYHDNYTGSRNLSTFLKSQRADIIRYRAISDIEYWNGSAWTDGSSQLANVEKLLDGRQDTNWNVPSTYYKFRFVVSASTGWPTMAMIGMQTSWSGSTYPGCNLSVEQLQTDNTTWTQKIDADLTSANGVSNWGLNFKASDSLHTGRQTTRITLDFSGWTPSNASYVTIPLQNIFITSNYAGTENTDYTNLLDYDRNATFAGSITCDDEVKVDGGAGYGRIEIGGNSGAFIDLKNPLSDDYDLRLITTGTGGSINVASGEFTIQRGGSNRLATTSSGIDITGTTTIEGEKVPKVFKQPGNPTAGEFEAGDLWWDTDGYVCRIAVTIGAGLAWFST